MLLSFKTELKPNNRQVTLFRQHCGVARHAYNFGNAAIQEALQLRETDKTVKLPSAIDLHKRKAPPKIRIKLGAGRYRANISGYCSEEFPILEMCLRKLLLDN